MPTILKNKTKLNDFTSKTNPLLNVHRRDILYREDIKTSFGYAIVGITITAALLGVGYVVTKQLIK
jgi:hypothetical protein